MANGLHKLYGRMKSTLSKHALHTCKTHWRTVDFYTLPSVRAYQIGFNNLGGSWLVTGSYIHTIEFMKNTIGKKER